MSELPEGWIDINWVEITTRDGFRRGPFGGNLKKEVFVEKGYSVYEQYAPINDDCKRFRYFITEEKYQELSSFWVEEGDFLISCSGTMGKITQVPIGSPKGVINQALLRVRLIKSAVYSGYFIKLFRSPAIQKKVLTKSCGGAIQNLAAVNELKEIKLPIPPLNEQKRIADKLDAVQARVDACRARLDRIPAILKRFRQSVLAAATSGNLTQDWRIYQPNEAQASIDIEELLTLRLSKLNKRGKSKPPISVDEIDSSEFFDLPETWHRTTLDQIIWSAKDGPHFSPKYVETGIPFISGGSIRAEGIDFSIAKFISPELHAELSARCKPEFNDILYTKGGTTGIARVNTEVRDFNVWVHVAVLKLVSTETTNPFFIQHVLNSPQGYIQSQRYTHGVGNQDLGLTRMIKIVIPLPPIKEQTEIVRRVESLFAYADRLEARYNTARGQVEKLTPALLAKAFRGELVPQDPNVEPASELLARIAAQRNLQKTTTNKSLRGRKRGEP